jgi:hypothetical protein
MKVKLKAYEYKGMLNKEFPSVEEAEKFAGIMTKKYPNFQFGLYVELDGGPAIGRSESEMSVVDSAEIDPSQIDTRPLDKPAIDLSEWDEDIAKSYLE